MARLRRKRRREILQQGIRINLHPAQRRAQIVRNGVGEFLHLRDGFAQRNRAAENDFLQFFLRALLVIDVGASAEPADDLCRSIANWKSASQKPAIIAGLPVFETVFDLERTLFPNAAEISVHRAAQIVGVKNAFPALFSKFAFREAGVFVPALVVVIDKSIRPSCPDDLRHRVGQFAKQDFDALLLGDIPSDFGRADDPPLFVFDRRNRQGNIQFRPILAPAHRLVMLDPLARAHRAEDAILFAQALRRDQQRHRFADHFVGSVAEEAFGASIPIGNDPIGNCNPLGLMRLLLYMPAPMEILEVKNRILMNFEWTWDHREIWMDGRQHPNDGP